MVDLTPLIATARRLITENGRSVTFQQLTGTPADPTKPWEGPVNPRSPVAASVTVDAVFVQPSSFAKLGLTAGVSQVMTNQTEQVLIVAQPDSDEALETFDEVVDGSTTWKIIGVEKLQPGSTAVIYFVGVKQ